MEKEIRYKLKISKRVRQMRLGVHRNGELVVTVPRGMDFGLVERFIAQKAEWIFDKLNYFESIRGKGTLLRQGFGRAKYLKYKEKAKILVKSRIEYYNKLYNFKVNKITIKNQKSRWGSCSKKGNLNFNYKIALLNQELADYVIVHELCHLAEFNHSKRFWKLVSLTIPNYRELKSKFHI